MKLPTRSLLGLTLFLLTSSLGSLFAQPAVTPVHITGFPSGVSRYEPGAWASLGIQALNRTDADAKPLLAVYFGPDEQTQFARQVWVPPHSMRKTWLPVRLPKTFDTQKSSVAMTLMPLQSSSQGEIIQHKEGMEMLQTSFVTIDREIIKSAAIFRKALPDMTGYIADLDNDAYEFYVRAKQVTAESRIVMDFSDDLIPPHVAMWDSLDQLILCSDRIVDDSAGLATLRTWLQQGGKVWIFLDRVQPSTVEAIVGHAQSYQVVDRVELDEFVIDFPKVFTAEARDMRRFEQPVEFVRVVTDTAEVACRVNGWPAAFAQRVGAGEVVFIALSPRGWLPAPIRPGDEKLPEYNLFEYRSSGAVEYLAKRFFDSPMEAAPAPAVVEPILQEQIGYRIPRRSLAATLLGLNCVALIAAGGWLASRQRLDQLMWLLPVLAFATTLIFVLIGRQNSRSVPPTIAFTQLIRMFPDTEEATVSGLAGLYHQEVTPLNMSGGPNGLVEPLATPMAGAIRRLFWTDEDRGHWQNVMLPGNSVQFIDFRRPTRGIGNVQATARFGPKGLEGSVTSGNLGKLQNAVITNTPAPSLHVDMKADGTFVCGPNEVLAEGQYTADRVLSDEARRRQAIYRQVVSAQDDNRLGRGANLLGWTGPVDSGIDWPAGLLQTGAALIAIPLRFQRTLAGEPFTVPATFLQAKATANESGQSMSYNDRTGVWLTGITRATRTALRFPLPAEVIPCRVSSARMTIKLNAPSRTLRVFSVINRQEHLVREIQNPSGVYVMNIDQPALLPPEVDNSLLFTIEITEAEDERVAREDREKQTRDRVASKRAAESKDDDKDKDKKQLVNSFSTWQIDYVRLDATGVVK
jgi:hypothetical protein